LNTSGVGGVAMAENQRLFFYLFLFWFILNAGTNIYQDLRRHPNIKIRNK